MIRFKAVLLRWAILAIDIVLATLVIALVMVARAFLLWLAVFLQPRNGEVVNWAVDLIGWAVDLGLVGGVLIVVVLTLWEQAADAYRAIRGPRDSAK